MEQPNNSGSHYCNYKVTDSIILMAVLGRDYQFLYADVGLYKRNTDGEVWSQGSMKKSIRKEHIKPTKPKLLFSDSDDTPYVCVGDDAFPLATYIMKPYPQRDLSPAKRIFNQRLSRARQICKNDFGILVNPWRVL